MVGLARHGGLPWHLPTDLKRFKKVTMGHTIIMGRKTFQSIGSPLPGRTNIVISRNADFEAPGLYLGSEFGTGPGCGASHKETEVFVIGGGQIFQHAFPLAQKILLTLVHTDAQCEVFFPALNWQEWEIHEQEFIPASEVDEYDTTYYQLSHKSA